MSVIELWESISLGIISRFTIIQEIYNHSKSQEWAEHACNANLSTFHSFLSTIFSPLQQTFVSITTALTSHNLDFKDKNNYFVVDLRSFTSDTCIALIKTVPNDQCGLVSAGLSIRTLGARASPTTRNHTHLIILFWNLTPFLHHWSFEIKAV